jgi:hypothetical protein
MKALQGYAEAKATSHTEIPKLPKGGYVLKILNVKEETGQWGDKIALQFEVEEGEYKGIFEEIYNATPDTWSNKKWKGAHRLNVPTNDGDTAKYNKSLGFFKSQIKAFEDSNAGLVIDCSKPWDVAVLKGKLVGAVFGEKEWAMDGKSGMFTNLRWFVSANDIREGKFKIPDPQMLTAEKKAEAGIYDSGFGNPAGTSDFVEDFSSDDGVPF